MFIYSAADIRKWDAYTMAHEPIAAIGLMERAAISMQKWLQSKYEPASGTQFCVVCGPGNNGGDGLALARLLSPDYEVVVVIMDAEKYAPNFTINLQRLRSTQVNIKSLHSIEDLSFIEANMVLVDAIFGTGINRPPEGLAANLIHAINALPNEVIAVDMPSGMYADSATPHGHIIAAHHTLSFQCAKLAFVMPENEQMLGQWQVLDIGLHPAFCEQFPPVYQLVLHPAPLVPAKHYSQYTHKGLRGHLLLGAGSATMMGAAILATRAALSSGAGLVTVATEPSAWPILQVAAPEAICAAGTALANADFLQQRRVKAVAVGPGWLPSEMHLQQLAWLFHQAEMPVLADASALAMLQPMLQTWQLGERKAAWIITPHVGEFDAMFGYSANHFERLQTAIAAAKKYSLVLVLKGKYSRIINPDGQVYFNATGNYGMAKGGSGDVLTGLIGGLLAQGYRPMDACILGTWLHGCAGDMAAAEVGTEAMTAQHIIKALPGAFKQWNQQAIAKPC